MKSGTGVTYYHNGSGTYPVLGDKIYKKPHGNKIYLADAGNYHIVDGVAHKNLVVGADKATKLTQVTLVLTC